MAYKRENVWADSEFTYDVFVQAVQYNEKEDYGVDNGHTRGL